MAWITIPERDDDEITAISRRLDQLVELTQQPPHFVLYEPEFLQREVAQRERLLAANRRATATPPAPAARRETSVAPGQTRVAEQPARRRIDPENIDKFRLAGGAFTAVKPFGGGQK